MNGKTDWLYRLIFEYVHDVWKQAQAYSENYNLHSRAAVYPEVRQPSPERLIVAQFREADFSGVDCKGPVFRTWRYDSAGLVPLVEPPEPFIVKQDSQVEGRDCRLFVQGVVSFYISPDRKCVVFTYWLGPLFGRGYVYAVSGQGKTGKLSQAPDSVSWIA